MVNVRVALAIGKLVVSWSDFRDTSLSEAGLVHVSDFRRTDLSHNGGYKSPFFS